MTTDTFANARTSAAPEEVLKHPGMISMQERRLLYNLAKDSYAGEGIMVDGGAFLGASALALASGLKANQVVSGSSRPQPPIFSYERAVVEPSLERYAAASGLPQLAVGESYADLLRELLAPVADLVELHVGDILNDDGQDIDKIEICFLDILKTPEVARHTLRLFMPKLLPGAYVIQQDYFFEELDYIKVFNEALSEKLAFLGEVRSSAVFRLLDTVSMAEVEDSFAPLDNLEEALVLHRRAEARTISPARQYLMRLSRARLYVRHGATELAEQTIDEADRLYPDISRDEDGNYPQNVAGRVKSVRNAIKRRSEPRPLITQPLEPRTISMEQKTGTRSPICAIPEQNLRTIQKGTMRYTWAGVLCNKNPFDFALYPMLLWRDKPQTIIEIGSKEGGSALWLRQICSIFGLDTKIVSVDIQQRAEVKHPDITFLQGDGRNLGETLDDDFMAKLPRPLLVIEDADHHYLTTLAVLRFMDRHLESGEYILVEDGICDSFGNEGKFDGGPNRAIAEFLEQNGDRYMIDTDFCDYYGYNVTWDTNGYLRRL